MDNYLLSIIKETTNYIEDNLLEELNLDNISENVNISKFHLLRIWKGATATGLMEYVRRRRIACSLKDLISEKNSIEFISSKYSFGCGHTYNRLFKEEFGTTPAKWRRNPTPLEILDRFNADFMSKTGEGLLFFRSITILPGFSIAGPEYVIYMEDNQLNQTANRYGIDFFYHQRPLVANPVNKDIYIGFTTIPAESKIFTGMTTIPAESKVFSDITTIPAESDAFTDTPIEYSSFSYYQPSLMIDNSSILPPGMKIKHVKPHKYGVFKYMGPHCPEEISSKTLKDIWNYVFGTWMPTIEFQLEEKFHFEYIDYSRCNKHYCECELYYPISEL